VECPAKYETGPDKLEKLRQNLNTTFKAQTKYIVDEAILKIELKEKENIKYYKGENCKKKFLKMVVMQPGFISPLKTIFEKGYDNFVPLTYESGLPYIMKFMIDKNIVGMGWLRLKVGGYKVTENSLSSC